MNVILTLYRLEELNLMLLRRKWTSLAVLLALLIGGACLALYGRIGYLDVSGEESFDTVFVSSPVTVYRDEFGVPHIFGDNIEDIMFASGYAMAEDRLFQIEMTVRAAMGQLAEILGPELVDHDKIARQNGYTPGELDSMIRNMPDDERRAFKSMVAGINLYVEQAASDPKSKLPLEFKASNIERTAFEEHEILAGVTLILRYFGASGGREVLNQSFLDFLRTKYDPQTADLIFDDILPLTDADAYSTAVDTMQ
ncbi:MAG: penicillin acylase family protein, partial [Pseudomonadota bacterium]